MIKRILILLCLSFIVGCASEKGEKKITKEKEIKETRKVSFRSVGDNLIHQTIYEEADAFSGSVGDGVYDFKPMYKHVKSEIEQADVSFINQETILGGKELGLSGYPNFNSPTEIAQNLKDTGFNMINLATNHSLDRNQAGINHTRKAFDDIPELISDGVYENSDSFAKIPVIEKHGIKIALLSYTYGTNGIEAPHEYSVSYFDEEQIRNDVAKAKEISDVIVVSAHWGDENTFVPNEHQKKYAKLFADLKVDVVIGTHPHTIHPVEWVEGVDGNRTLVAYSLGNFLGGMLKVDNVLSGMLMFDFVEDAKTKEIKVDNVKWEPLVIHFEGNQANIIQERYAYQVYKLKDYSKELAKKHVLNGYEGQEVTTTYFKDKTEEIVSMEFLK